VFRKLYYFSRRRLLGCTACEETFRCGSSSCFRKKVDLGIAMSCKYAVTIFLGCAVGMFSDTCCVSDKLWCPIPNEPDCGASPTARVARIKPLCAEEETAEVTSHEWRQCGRPAPLYEQVWSSAPNSPKLVLAPRAASLHRP
jgi:hypothetical protein